MNNWIKTEDRLPENGQRVLCVVDGEDEASLLKYLSGGTFKHYGAMGTTYLDRTEIPYWMPLPKIPHD